MRRCPLCGREYDLTMNFCLDDGSELLYGPASEVEPATAIFSSSGVKQGLFAADSPVASSNSIAVLPFTHMSSDGDNEYFCDGLTEELINALSKIDELKVAARTSAFSFKGKEADVPTIANKLGVKTVLEGSVRKSGARMRITAQLINAADGYHLWSERYDRQMKDIFDVQDEITLAVVDALKVKLLGKTKIALLKRQTTIPAAYEAYLRGLSHINRFTPLDLHKAIEHFRQAIAIDPHYASAYAALSVADTEMAFRSSSDEWMPKAMQAVKKALELDDTLGEAHASSGVIKMYYQWDYAGAEAAFRRALELDPGSAHVHMWYGWYLGLMGRFDESFNEYQQAWEIDPLSDPVNVGIGVMYLWSGQPARSIEIFRRVMELSPGYVVTYPFLAEAYLQIGDLVSAVAVIERVSEDMDDHMVLASFGYAYARAGDRDKAIEILNKLEKKRSNLEFVSAFNLAQIYVGLGDSEKAIASLEEAYSEPSLWMSFLGVDHKFDSLRSDTRFQNLLLRVGLTE